MCGPADDVNSPEMLASLLLDGGECSVVELAQPFLGLTTTKTLDDVARFLRWLESEGLATLTESGNIARPTA